MHKSRLGTVVIDCKTDSVDAAARLWETALGWPSKRLPDADNTDYRRLEGTGQ